MAKTFGQYGRHRFWEILPAALAWSAFIFAFWSSFFAPVVAVIFIIIFDLYWTLRVLYFLIHVLHAYRQYRKTVATNWFEKVRNIEGYRSVWHVVMLPTYKEPIEVLRESLNAIARAAYENDRFIVIVGGEERDKKQFLRHAAQLKKEFSGLFAHLMFTVHPADIEGEIPGKGANMKWMAQKVRPYIDKKKIPYEDIVVSAFDSDTIGHDQYFARLAYLFRTVDSPLRTSYQPLVLFSNNIWYANPVVRVASFGTTFWLLSELVRSERMWTFSSHSMPWQMLVDVGYHEPDLVSEDSRIFMQGFVRYDGNYRVTPMFMPVHMDAVEASGFWNSIAALYKQQRRWAWGVEHTPYMFEKFKGNTAIPWRARFAYMFNHIEGMFTWATAPVLIFVLGYLPFFVASDNTNALVANGPFTLEIMMQVATIGVFATGIMSFLFLPKRPEKVSRFNWIIMILQWGLLPFTFTLLGALPAIDAQTRFALGKYLGFNVTEKKR